MNRRQKRDRRSTAPTSAPVGPGPDEGAPHSPPGPAGAPSVSALSAAASAAAEHASPDAVARLRAELLRTLATALDLATEAGDVDQMLKVTDRLAKLLPSGSGVPTPAPDSGGGTDGTDCAGAPSAAERFRLLSGELGN